MWQGLCVTKHAQQRSSVVWGACMRACSYCSQRVDIGGELLECRSSCLRQVDKQTMLITSAFTSFASATRLSTVLLM